MCMQGFDSKRVIALLILASPFILVGTGVVVAGRAIKHVVVREGPVRRRDRLKAKINHLKEKLKTDEVEQQLKQLKKLQQENQGTEEGAYFGLQIAAAHYYLRDDEEEGIKQLDETIKFLEALKKEYHITYKGNKILMFAYYTAATIANDNYKYDEALKYFDEAVQQWTILDSTPLCQKATWTLHSFEERNFHKPRKCDVCQKTLFGTSRHGLICKVCDCIVHPPCLVDIATPCNHNPNNNQSSGMEGLMSTEVTLTSLLNSRGLAYYYTGQYDKALSDFDAVIRASQANQNDGADQKATLGLYYANRGLVEFYQKNLEGSIADTTTAIGHGFINAQIYTIRGSAFQLLGRIQEAQQDRKKARECDPSAPLDVFPYQLPMELIITVFSFLQISDLARAAQSCKLWKQIIYDHTQLAFQQQYHDMRNEGF